MNIPWQTGALTAVILSGSCVNLTAGTARSPKSTPSIAAPEITLLPFSFAGLGLVASDAHPFLRDTRFILSGRLRYEFGQLDGREDSNALTWRHRVGIETGEWLGFSVLGELEHTWDLLGEDQYNPFPGAGRTVIADPGNFELNQLQLQFRNDFLTLVGGRQRITLDDQRFVGSVGWRQNEHTFDAIRIELTPADDLTLNYAWLWRVNRIFGEQVPRAALNHFDSDSHLINLRYDGLSCGTFTGYSYLLDFKEAPALSSQTFGLRFNGAAPLSEGVSLLYDLQWAVQKDYQENAADYMANYYRIEGGLNFENAVQFGIGYEVLAENDGVGFQTPLGTNHKFNGFADSFLMTPASGLQDLYAWVGSPLPGGINAKLAYHHFLTDTNKTKIGDEIDFTLGRELGEHATALLKAAFLCGNGAQPDITRVSCQIDYSF